MTYKENNWKRELNKSVVMRLRHVFRVHKIATNVLLKSLVAFCGSVGVLIGMLKELGNRAKRRGKCNFHHSENFEAWLCFAIRCFL